MDDLHILQHALGLDRYGQGNSYRSHFVATEGSADYARCMVLVDDGMMVRHGPSSLYGGDTSYCFLVTDAGRAYVAEHSPKPPLRLCLVCQTRLPLNRFALDTGQIERQCLDCSDVRKPAARVVERWKSRDQHKGAMDRLMSLGYAASTARAWAHSPGRLTRAAARRVLLLEWKRKNSEESTAEM